MEYVGMKYMNERALEKYRAMQVVLQANEGIKTETLARACITALPEFMDKTAFIYVEIDDHYNYDIGRLYKVRKTATENENQTYYDLTNEAPTERFIWLDYYMQKSTKKKFQSEEEEEDLYKGIFPLKKQKGDNTIKAKPPRPGETLTLKNRNRSELDRESVDIFQVRVIETYPGLLSKDKRDDNIRIHETPNFGAVKAEIVQTVYKLKRSPALPPLIDKRMRRGEFAN